MKRIAIAATTTTALGLAAGGAAAPTTPQVPHRFKDDCGSGGSTN
jgi:hypothetical protein